MFSIATAMVLSLVAVPSAQAIYGGAWFLEVNGNNERVLWARSGNTYVRVDAVPGGDDRLITGMGFERSAIVKTNNDLYYCTPGCAFVSGNWQARLITGINAIIFLEVTHGGHLVQWDRQVNGSWAPTEIGQGWQNARLIAGLDSNTFVEVKFDGRLAKWTRNGREWSQLIIGAGWSDARLLAGVNGTRFVQVRSDGVLIEWNASGNTYVPTTIGPGWGATKLLG
ncbi:hypothetical protein BBK82_29600 [Lentzea guizhouensis]|uniref:Tachylectin 2 domain-containing protein n=1 Tax=Lentzea guizhouensis TaxID=1586287 RepID=A0A1B2HPF4_9PSEU|nr:hypothetical protein [Lentzea guizhouensis]ANZ39586.1 hypothetical protein BBK82_29600 [Lentzea guizhouensis]